MRLWVALWCFSFPLTAQRTFMETDDAMLLLARVRNKVLQTVDRLPKYLCTETVDRMIFDPKNEIEPHNCDDLAGLRKKRGWKMRERSSDRLRLDVAVSGDSEMYSWVGEHRFADSSLANLVRGGATSTGAFASIVTAIFGGNIATFSYEGDIQYNGRLLAEFAFRVPMEKSKYQIGDALRRAIVGYDGKFWADPTSFDLVRLVIDAGHIPEELNACESKTTLDYAKLQLNGSEFLIPKQAVWEVLRLDGTYLENRTSFSSCHEFRGESTLRFTIDENNSESTAKSGAQHRNIPAGLSFRIALAQPIDTAIAAAGDPVKAVLVTAIKDKHGAVFFPKGAAVTGRLIRVERSYLDRPQALTVGLKLETLDANGLTESFAAKVESGVERRERSLQGMFGRENLGSLDRPSDMGDPSTGFIKFENVTSDFVIRPGLQLQCTTAEIPREMAH